MIPYNSVWCGLSQNIKKKLKENKQKKDIKIFDIGEHLTKTP